MLLSSHNLEYNKSQFQKILSSGLFLHLFRDENILKGIDNLVIETSNLSLIQYREYVAGENIPNQLK